MNIQGVYKLIATEPEKAYEPRIVEFIKTLTIGEREDFVWAKVIPKFTTPTFSIEQDLDFVILGARHFGYSLLEVGDFPIHVYVCIPKRTEKLLEDKINSEDISILNWAMLLDKDDERNDLQTIFENDHTITSYTINNIR
jgi:hypothetical protein